MQIACIHAHPDDAEFLAGGTLAILASLGHQIRIVSMTAGDCGSADLAPAEISAIRKGEAAASARLIDAEYHCAGFHDLAIFDDDPSRRRVTGLLRDLRCDIIVTASPEDYLCDHEATSTLVRDACFAASVRNYEAAGESAPLAEIPALYFVDSIGRRDRAGRTIPPDFTVDVASSFDTKKAMLAQHNSQRAWLKQQHGMDDYLEQMETWTRECGARAGIGLGEGFRQYRMHPYPTAPVLQQLLAEFIAGQAHEPSR